MKDKIFIQIASYRDPQLPLTIQSLLENAKWPENLIFSIANQWSTEDSFTLDEYRGDSRFKIIDIPAHESMGACNARWKLQQQYSGEEWTLQLDSHHRFVQDWDEILIHMWTGLHESGVAKPLITSYISSYDPENDPAGRATSPFKIGFNQWGPDGILTYKSEYITNWEELTAPISTYFYSAHFAFAKGEFVKEVPHDPNLYFIGEEPSIAARAWTWGYDLFHPHIHIAYHEYTRKGRVKHWDEHKTWWKIDAASKKRYRQLVGQEPDQVRDWGPWGWGPVRDFSGYAQASGIDFKRKIYNQ